MPVLRSEHVNVYYEQQGCGPDIVWLAGGDQRGSSWHDYQTPAFADTYRQTTYDARGVGETRTSAPLPWSIPDYADDCFTLITSVCTPPVFLVGLSMGSLIAQEIALSHPQVVRCAVLMGTAAKPSRYMREWEVAEVNFRRQGRELTADFATTHYAVFMYPSEVLGDDSLWEKVRPIVTRDYGQRHGEELAAQWHACVEYESEDRLGQCNVPLHVIAFSHDVQAPPALGRVVAELAPDGHFHLLDGLGHCSCFGHKPVVVNACVREILAQYSS